MDEVVEPPALKGGVWSPREGITVSITVKETEHPVGTVKNRVSGKRCGASTTTTHCMMWLKVEEPGPTQASKSGQCR